MSETMFTRIYSGIFLSILLAAALNYGLYSLSYEKRHNHYEERSLSGVMALIADALPQRTDKIRNRYLEIAAKLLGADLIQHGGNFAEPLTAQDWQALHNGKTVEIQSPDPSARWLIPTRVQTYETPVDLVELRIDLLSEQQFRGHALLLLAEMSRRENPLELQQLQAYSGYPLDLLSRQELRLDQQQRSRLRKGSAVVVYDPDGGHHFSVYVPWQSDHVLRLGPIPQFEKLPLSLVLQMIAITIFVIATVSYWLVFRLERRLGAISTMVHSYGEGDLDTRVKLQGQDRIASVGEKINDMADRIQSLLKSQREIMQAVSHELRTPLSRIRFRLAMLDDDLLESGIDPRSDDIRGDIDQLEQLISEVLEHHKLIHQPQLEKSPLCLTKPVAEVIANLQILHPAIHFDTRQLLQESLIAHPLSLSRLLQNLISNACKHASDQVKISSNISNSHYTLVVEDDGLGIPDQERTKIFDAFYRVDTSRNQQTGGYGLGLAIVKRIVDLHEGSINVAESSLGGASFSVNFLRIEAQNDADTLDSAL